MELVKKTILQALTTGTTATTTGIKYIIIPDLLAVYHMKLGFTSVVKDIGFFDVDLGYGYGYYGSSDGGFFGIGEDLLMNDNYI
jgi:hypothetical protein